MVNRVYIRVDGNEIIASGHVMRCLTIAEQIRKKGAEVIFIVADDKPVELIKSRGFDVDILNTVWNKLDYETEILCAYIKEHNVKNLLIDSYYVTIEYLQKLSLCVKVIYIDDLYRFAYPVDTVINYSVLLDTELYENLYRDSGLNPHLLIGGCYVPLREEFVLKPFKVNAQVKRVLITTGGTDQLNIAESLLKTIMRNSELSQLDYHVIVGSFNQNKEELYFLANLYSNIYLHENVNNMAERMRTCDVAISATGTTIFELCACGVPSICLEVADNQKGAKMGEKRGYILYAGNAYEEKEKCIERCKEALLFYKRHYAERKEKSIRMQSLVDGYGAKRIAEYILFAEK